MTRATTKTRPHAPLNPLAQLTARKSHSSKPSFGMTTEADGAESFSRHLAALTTNQPSYNPRLGHGTARGPVPDKAPAKPAGIRRLRRSRQTQIRQDRPSDNHPAPNRPLEQSRTDAASSQRPERSRTERRTSKEDRDQNRAKGSTERQAVLGAYQPMTLFNPAVSEYNLAPKRQPLPGTAGGFPWTANPLSGAYDLQGASQLGFAKTASYGQPITPIQMAGHGASITTSPLLAENDLTATAFFSAKALIEEGSGLDAAVKLGQGLLGANAAEAAMKLPPGTLPSTDEADAYGGLSSDELTSAGLLSADRFLSASGSLPAKGSLPVDGFPSIDGFPTVDDSPSAESLAYSDFGQASDGFEAPANPLAQPDGQLPKDALRAFDPATLNEDLARPAQGELTDADGSPAASDTLNQQMRQLLASPGDQSGIARVVAAQRFRQINKDIEQKAELETNLTEQADDTFQAGLSATSPLSPGSSGASSSAPQALDAVTLGRGDVPLGAEREPSALMTGGRSSETPRDVARSTSFTVTGGQETAEPARGELSSALKQSILSHSIRLAQGGGTASVTVQAGSSGPLGITVAVGGGQVDIQLATADEDLSDTLNTETPALLDALRKQLPGQDIAIKVNPADESAMAENFSGDDQDPYQQNRDTPDDNQGQRSPGGDTSPAAPKPAARNQAEARAQARYKNQGQNHQGVLYQRA